MFCRVVGVAALGLFLSAAAWAQSSGSTSDQSTSGQSTGTQSGSDPSGSSSQSGTGATTGTTSTTTTGAGDRDTSTSTQTTTTTTTDVDVDTDVDRPRLELTGFAGYTFNQGLDFSDDGNGNLSARDVNFYNSIGLDDQFSYGAGLGYDITPNLQIGVLWSRMSSPLQLRGFDNNAALAAGWSGPNSGGGTAGGGTGGTGTGGTGTGDGTGTGGTSTGGTGAVSASFPVLVTTNGAPAHRIGDLDVNTFHGTLGWNFGPVDAPVRPFIFGGAGVTRYGELEYEFADVRAGAAPNARVNATIESESRFSTTWGVGVKIAPTRGLGIRIAGRWTPTRLAGGNFVSTSGGTGGTSTGDGGTSGTAVSGSNLTGGTNQGWWCSGQWGCFANESRFLNHFSLTGGLVLRF